MTKAAGRPFDTVKMSTVDRAYAGHSVAYLVGPLERIDEPGRMLERLKAIARYGPRNRIGLIPDANSRKWRFDPNCTSIVIGEGVQADYENPLVALDTLSGVAPSIDDTPLYIHIANQWLFLSFDHGLGGGRLFTEVIAAIGSDDAGFAEPAPLSDCLNPGIRAAGHTVRSSPRQLLRALREPVRRSSAPSGTAAFSGDVSVAYARSDPDFLVRAREIRDRDWPGVSMSALITSCFLRALSKVGITPENDVSVMVDLGRHLPSNTGTLSNFIGTAPISIQPPYSPSLIAAALDAYTSGCRSLVRYGASYASRLRATTSSNMTWIPGSSRARVVITDHSNTSAGKKISWLKSEHSHAFVRRAPVGFANQITLAINRVNSELHLTASYYSAVFDGSCVQSSVDCLVTVEGFQRLLD